MRKNVLLLTLLAFCVQATACGSSSDDDGAGGSDDGGESGNPSGGTAGSTSGGTAGSAKGGTAGTSTGGSSGSSSGASSGGTSGAGGTEMCPTPEPMHPNACFASCGGSPLGRWILEETCVRDVVGPIGGCETRFTATGTPDFRMDFREGGLMRVTGSEIWGFDFRLACGSCPGEWITEPGLMAFRPQIGRIFCEEQSCGDCRCDDFGIVGTMGDDDWLVQDNLLILGSGPVLDFCVAEDEMWLGHAEQGMSYRLRRVECTGTPTPCAMRSTDDCEAGGRCVLGACEPSGGGSSCDALTAETCETVSGCSWNATMCSGIAASVCDFDYCREEPGCEFVDADRPCEGTAQACESRDAATCGGAPGCRLGTCAASTGSDTRNCSAVSFGVCETVTGCILTSDIQCIGMADCSEQTYSGACQTLGCSWTASTSCMGDATPCAELGAARCSSQPGCTLGP